MARSASEMVRAEHFDDLMHVFGNGGLEQHACEFGRMHELEAMRVQGLAVDQGHVAGVGWPAVGLSLEISAGDLAATVHDIADDGVADMGAMDAQLVRAAGAGGEFEECVCGASGGTGRASGADAKPFFDGVDRLRRLADIGADGVFLAHFGVDAERGVDQIGGQFHLTVHEGEVGFSDCPALELAREPPVRLISFGDEDEAGGVAVEAVDDAGAPGIGAGRELRAVGLGMP